MNGFSMDDIRRHQAKHSQPTIRPAGTPAQKPLSANDKPPADNAPKMPKKELSSPNLATLSLKTVQDSGKAPSKPRRGKQMNMTETRMLAWLKLAFPDHTITFEAVKLRIAENCYYCPDFMAVSPSGETITFYEAKGAHVWDDSKVKFKAAKERYPHWAFECWQWKKGEWKQII